MDPQKRVTKNGTVRWVARYRDHHGKERSKSFDTRREARAYAEEQETKLRRGTWINPKDANVTIGELARAWADQPGRDNTVANRTALVKNLGDLDGMLVGAVRSTDITTWYNQLIYGRPWKDKKKLSKSSAANLAGMLAGLFDRALDDMIIERVPKITVPKGATTVVHRSDLLTSNEIAALIKHCNEKRFNSPARPWLAAMIAVAAGSGLRVSELGGLLVGNVDRLNMQLHVEMQSNMDGTERVVLKSDCAYRSVPVPEVVFEVIDRHLFQCPRRPDEPVFFRMVRGKERMHTKNSANAALSRVQRLHGLRDKTFHDFRHYYASQLIAAGVPVTGVQAALGHANAQTTLNTYAHLWPGQEALTRQAAAAGSEFLRDPDGIWAIRDLSKPVDSPAPLQVAG